MKNDTKSTKRFVYPSVDIINFDNNDVIITSNENDPENKDID